MLIKDDPHKAPNGTNPGSSKIANCGVPPDTGDGCLYDVTADPTEHHNLMDMEMDAESKGRSDARIYSYDIQEQFR